MGLLGHVRSLVEKASGVGTVPVHVFHAEHEHDGWSCGSQVVTMSYGATVCTGLVLWPSIQLDVL